MENLQSSSTEDIINSFVDQLMTEKQFNTQDPDILAELKMDLKERLDIHVNAGLLSVVPKEKLEELERLLADDDTAKLQDFFIRTVPNLPAQLTKILADFRISFLTR